MKRWKKVVLGVLVVLVVAVGALAVWQRSNLTALYSALTKDRETLSQELQSKVDEHQEALAGSGVTVTAPSAQLNEDLLDGKVSAEEVKEALGLLTQTSGAADSVPAGGQSGGSGTGQASQTSGSSAAAEALLNQCVAELYSLQVDLMAQLGTMKQAAVNQWVALPAEERTSAKKQEIGMAGLQECYDLEAETDGEVQGILAKYRSKLEKLGADASTLDDLWVYYCEEKEAQKAFYLNKYLN